MRRRLVPFLALCLICLGGISRAQISTALGVRSLSADQAKEGRAVRLRGTVVFIEAPGTVFLQDRSAGTFFRTKLPVGDLRLGDEVEVEGATFPGLFLPGIETTSFQVLRSGALSAPQPASYEDLMSSRLHYQLVEVEGIVRSAATTEENRSVLRLAMGSRHLELRLNQAMEAAPLIGARVSVQGLAAGEINDRRQLVRPYLKVSEISHVRLLQAAPELPDLPVQAASAILRFETSGASGQWVRVRGTVLSSFDDGWVFLRDDASALAVRLAQPIALAAGEVVDLAGFPEMGKFSAALLDSLVLNRAAGRSLPAHELDAKTLFTGTFDGDLVSVAGQVVDVATGRTQVLQIKSQDRTWRAVLSPGQKTDVTPGSEVRLTGICRVEEARGHGFNARPESIALLLRSADDVRVVRAPSWWTARRLAYALGITATVMALGFVWIGLLRKQVSVLRQRIQRDAALEERQRIAREFHDSLEQELAGLRLRMDAAVTRPMDDKARSLLEASQGLVERIQAEARNLVADLREDSSSGVDLPTALHELAARQTSEQTIVDFEDGAALPEMPGHVVHHLRMIAQEAVTNAYKHAQASKIVIDVQSDGERLTMMVKDNGRGLADEAVTQGRPGHFGCMGVRERCRKIGAEVHWQSSPGQGTTVVVGWSKTVGESWPIS